MSRLLLILTLLVVLTTEGMGAVIHVPGDQPTIQAGIDAAAVGDTVLVACGTYYEHDIIMKSGICLRSASGLADCVVIDAAQQGRVMLCDGVGATTTIQGITLRNGVGWSARLENGAGIHCRDSSPVITDVVLTENSALGRKGGGLYCLRSSPVLVRVAFRANVAEKGAGMYCDYGAPTLESCGFSLNSADGSGGGIYVRHGGFLTQVMFRQNDAAFMGGGAHCPYPSSAQFVGCTFIENTASYGGGLACNDSSPSVTGCTFAGNAARGAGGGGAVLSYGYQSSPALANTIIAFSAAGEGVGCLSNGSATLTCSDVYGNEGGDWVGCIADQYGINGNISEHPCFCFDANPDQPYALCVNSPCAAENSPECGQIGAWPAACDDYEPCPAEDTSWGSVKAMFR